MNVDFVKLINDYGGTIALILAAIPLFFAFIIGIFKFGQYVNVKRKIQKQTEYKNFHELIERLTAPRKGDDNTWLDIQNAAAFELRNYPRYTEVTEIILRGWIKRRTGTELIMKSTLKKLKRPYNPKS